MVVLSYPPFFVRGSFYPPISSVIGYLSPINYGPTIIANNPAIPFHPPPINTVNNPQIIFHTLSFAMANNTPISFGAPPINTIHHTPIITPHNPSASFFGGCSFYPHDQVAHGHMVAPSYWPGPAGLAPPRPTDFDSAPRNDWWTLSSPSSPTESNETPQTNPAEEDNWTMGRPVDDPPTSFYPPVIAPHNPPVSYFNGYPFYPPSAHGQFATSNYWPGPAGSAPHDLAYFGPDPRQHYFPRSSSPCSSTESNETPPDDLVEEDERSMVDEPIVRVNSPVEIENKENKLHGMDIASLSVEKLARGMRQCHISPTSKFIWPPTEEQDAYFTEVLYVTSCKRRLQVFSDICSISIR